MAGPEPQVILDKHLCGGCECSTYCWRNISQDSVSRMFKGAQGYKLLEEGHTRVQDVPIEKIKNERVRRWLDVYRTQLPYINKEAVANWLKKLVYPLYLLRLFSQNVR